MSKLLKLPSTAELLRAEKATPGGAERLFEIHCEALVNNERRLDEELELKKRKSRHLQTYQMLSIACGTFLGCASLFLCGFGIYQKADLAPLALVLGPVSAIAGVFVWGYRPKETDGTSKISDSSTSTSTDLA